MVNQNTIIEFVGSSFGEGGAETLIKDYSLFLSRKKCKTIILTLGAPDKKSGNYQQLANDVEVISLFGSTHRIIRPIKKLIVKLFTRWYVRRRFSNILTKYNPVAIHAHLNVLSFLAMASDVFSGVRLLYTCHNHPNVHLCKRGKKDELFAAKFLIQNNHLQMIALHEDMRNELNTLLNINNTVVVHNGIDFRRFSNVYETKNEVRKSLDIPDNSFVIGHVGSFGIAKNHPYLLHIFFEYCKIHNNAILMLVGNGDPSATMQLADNLRIKDKVVLLSHRKDVPRLLSAMDIFVFPSKYEGLPVSMVEAQAMGLRCLASDRITSECFFSKNAVPLSIDEEPRKWALAIDDNTIEGIFENDITLFNNEMVIDHLLSLYGIK